MQWKGTQFFVCMLLDFRKKSFNKIQNILFVDTLVLCRTPQPANIVCFTGFRKDKLIQQM